MGNHPKTGVAQLAKLALAGALILGMGPFLQGRPPQDSDEPPVAGQPPNFGGAVGSFTVATRAEPTTLQAEDPLTFTVTITATGPVRRPPRRPLLHRYPEFTRAFVVEDDSDLAAPARPGAWVFAYRLKPLSPGVREIPELRFDYYKPGIFPPEKGYRVAYADPIPLTVLPRAEVPPAAIQAPTNPLRVPEGIYRLEQVPEAVLRREEPFTLPGVFPLVLGFLAPPVLCATWYVLWRQRYPDATRQARRRQSRAARQALQALRAGRPDGADHPSLASLIVTEYLRERWDLPSAEPAPTEVAAHLTRQGCPAPCAYQTAAFFRACDAARFAPRSSPNGNGLRAAAVRLIHALEAAPCPDYT